MSEIERRSGLADRFDRGSFVESRPVERGAFDELHREERSSLMLADLVDRGDVRVAQPARELSFAKEPLFLIRIAGGNELDGDEALEIFLPGLPDRPHSPGADRFDTDEFAQIVRRIFIRLADFGGKIRG